MRLFQHVKVLTLVLKVGIGKIVMGPEKIYLGFDQAIKD